MCEKMQQPRTETVKNQLITPGTHLVGTHGLDMRPNAAGFSLIEALIVVGLVSIVAAASAPTVAEGITRYTITSASQQVASTIRGARFQAVGRNTALQVRFNFPAAGQYQVVDMANAAVGEVQMLPNSVTFGQATTDLQVTTSGRMAPAATITVTDGNTANNRTITVATSGRIQLQ
jgi:type IV fimbrial biogenesis protein FimT